MKKVFKKIKRLLWKTRYFQLGAAFIVFLIWLFCIPSQFFDAPTCTILTDKDGNILNARIADDGQWRFPPRKTVPEKFKTAIIQFEDRGFESHWGISPSSFARAMKQNLSAGRVVSGGSTISMQVVRLSRMGKSRSISEKVVEVFQATRMEWSYSKEEILAMYASYAPMGGNVVGIDAAAWRYFGRKAEELSWAESCLLAVLPNAPSLLHLDRNRQALKDKRDRLLKRLHEIGELDDTDLQLAMAEPLPSAPPDLPNLAPHLTDKAIKSGKKGQWITANLDKSIQQKVTDIVAYHNELLSENEINNAAVVVLDLKSKETVAYVGNTMHPQAAHGNHVDVVTAPRSTGSILKPFLYASLLEDGIITPDQLVEDVPMIVSGYAPKNYDKKYDGAVPASRALSRSLNVPIVKLLNRYGVQKFHDKLNKIGMTTVNRPSSNYGLSLVLGGAEATLWDLACIYGSMSLSLQNFNTEEVNQYQFKTFEGKGSKNSYSSFDPAAVYETFEAMVKVARPEEDGQWEQFQTSQKIAWKTGTSYGFRDAWAIGVNKDYVVAVWVGNGDGEGRPGLVGVKAAAPILFDVFDLLPKSEWFTPPYDLMKPVLICRETGFKAQSCCENADTVWVPLACENAKPCPYHQTIHLHKQTGERVHLNCVSPSEMISVNWLSFPPVMEQYYKQKHPTYQPLPEIKAGCEAGFDMESIGLIYPKSGSKIYLPTQLDGKVSETIFEASHSRSDATLYWHLDGVFIGETYDIHQISIQPKAGKHELVLVDDKGYELTRKFEMLEK